MSKLKRTQVARNAMNLDEQADMRADETNAIRELSAKLEARGYDLNELEQDSPYHFTLEDM